MKKLNLISQFMQVIGFSRIPMKKNIGEVNQATQILSGPQCKN